MAVACVHRSDDQCVTDVDCGKGVACTRSECEGIPKKCSSARIVECIGGDGCCPQGCTYALDFDCPADKCGSDADCDDGDESTIGVCKGSPKSCVYGPITKCVGGDGVCETWCDEENDSDCEAVQQCASASDCNDRDPSTLDFCEEGICVHRLITQCANNDGYCPPRCSYTTDSDCIANPGNAERLVVTCNGVSTNVDAALQQEGGEFVASFDTVVNNSTNSALKYYQTMNYKYNYMETGNGGTETGLQTGIAEKIRIQGKAYYDKTDKTSYFYFNRDGLQYEVELFQGIPATQTDKTTAPLVVGNGDRIPIALFGTDSLVTMVNQQDGNQQLSVLSNYVELSVTGSRPILRIAGKDGWDYSIRVSRCDSDSAVFVLYLKDNFIESQTVKTGSILFPDKLKGAVRLNYLYKDSITGKCDYRYAKGDYIENFYQGKQFPADYGRVLPWNVNLVFENNRLKKLQLNNTAVPNQELETKGSEWVLKEGNTVGAGFCEVKFYGLVK
jgi:hypothetical protein